MHGEVDVFTHDLFATAVDSAIVEAGNGETPRDDAHLDLADLQFIDVCGARALVSAAAKRHPGSQLVIHNPPRILRRVLELGWDHLPGLRLEQAAGVVADSAGAGSSGTARG